MKIAILGAGAIGCTLGAALSERHEVELVARGTHLEALRSRGLELDGTRYTTHPDHGRLRVSGSLSHGADVIIAAAKSQDLDASLRDAPVSGATIVTIQNGLAAEAIAARHASDIVGCVTAIDAEFLEPGIVRVGRVGGLVLGRASAPADSPVEELVRVFKEAGIPTRASDNLVGARWTKLLVNLNNAVLAASGLTAQQAFARDDIPRLCLRIVREGLAVARAEGVRLEAIPWADPRQVSLVAKLPERLGATLLAMRVRRDAGTTALRGSTLQSLMRGRGTETDFLNGEVVRRGALHGVPTPANASMMRAVACVATTGEFLPVADMLIA